MTKPVPAPVKMICAGSIADLIAVLRIRSKDQPDQCPQLIALGVVAGRHRARENTRWRKQVWCG
ncbi:MAG TPA: hypothetical protein VM867_08610, partial [Xanthobacteraceae bacterium]|nr:hypothetical protein [Xanthobacteraceae bacterium]